MSIMTDRAGNWEIGGVSPAWKDNRAMFHPFEQSFADGARMADTALHHACFTLLQDGRTDVGIRSRMQRQLPLVKGRMMIIMTAATHLRCHRDLGADGSVTDIGDVIRCRPV